MTTFNLEDLLEDLLEADLGDLLEIGIKRAIRKKLWKLFKKTKAYAIAKEKIKSCLLGIKIYPSRKK